MTRILWSRMAGTLVVLVGWYVLASAQAPNPDRPFGVPDITQSYYVPQAGLDYENPVEGDEAIQYFHACPNNDGGPTSDADGDSSSLPLAARIKVVLRDVNGNGISGISAADICILFNGGTLAQGFSGVGADSIIANSAFNPAVPFPPSGAAPCPDVRCVPADAPTDANGVAYITFTGPGGIRDPNRKWGHYDFELPVYVMGTKIPGRLTSSPGSGPYVLEIKNFDVNLGGGLGTGLNLGEQVSAADFTSVTSSVGPDSLQDNLRAVRRWRDFDSNGEVDQADYNMVRYHLGHNCVFPNNP